MVIPTPLRGSWVVQLENGFDSMNCCCNARKEAVISKRGWSSLFILTSDDVAYMKTRYNLLEIRFPVRKPYSSQLRVRVPLCFSHTTILPVAA